MTDIHTIMYLSPLTSPKRLLSAAHGVHSRACYLPSTASFVFRHVSMYVSAIGREGIPESLEVVEAQLAQGARISTFWDVASNRHALCQT